MPSNIEFSNNEAIDDHLHSVKEALEANVYTSVDLKVKIITKEQNKQLKINSLLLRIQRPHTNVIQLLLTILIA